jgi:hypothetical protein
MKDVRRPVFYAIHICQIAHGIIITLPMQSGRARDHACSQCLLMKVGGHCVGHHSKFLNARGARGRRLLLNRSIMRHGLAPRRSAAG